MDGQLRALTNTLERTEHQYRAKLQAHAPDSLSCFVEFMTPDEPPFAHHEFFCEKLEAIERHDLLRGCFSCPPGHAKTKFFSRMFPAWYLGKNPRHRYLQGGHSQDFAEKQFGQYVRDIILDPNYQLIFPEVTLNPRSTAAGDWRLAGPRAGAYVAKGVGQGIAGYRGHCGGIDDPFAKREDAHSPTIREKTGNWLFTDWRTRLLPGSPLFIVATRWHPDDLIGRVEKLNKEGKGIPWEIYNLVAVVESEEEMEADPMGRSMGEPLWPEYYTFAELMDIKATSVSSDWWALYKGSPRDEEGNVVKSVWFVRDKQRPQDVIVNGIVKERVVKRITVSVDCAEKATKRSKYTAIGVWVETFDGHHHLVHVVRKKLEFVEMTKAINETAASWGASAILVEDAGNGTPYIQQSHTLNTAPCPVIAIPKPSNDDKQFRFDSITPLFEAGMVHLPETALWLPDYEAELLSFPNAAASDQVDMTSQYLAWGRKKGQYGSQKIKTAA
jgi:predicted phage terminase large subunit-like protein